MLLIVSMPHQQRHTDIITKGWINLIPRPLRPYFYLMRLDRPIGTWLLLLPSWWAILLSGGLSAWKTMILFAVGSLIMRGAGCVINDLWDRDLDGQVERTATRPIPAGDITPKQALIFLCALLCVGLVILLQFNPFTIGLGVLSLIFVIIYPLMKRITWWPQLFLGLTFNFGALMGWAAVTGDIGWQAITLYIVGIFWTLGYDTIYAFQDMEDDALIGIKSSARYLVEKVTILSPSTIITGFYAIHYALLWGTCFSDTSLGIGLTITALPLLHLLWQAQTLSTTDPKNSLTRFKSNRDYGLLICVVILILS